MRMTVKVTTNLGHASTAVEGPHGYECHLD